MDRCETKSPGFSFTIDPLPNMNMRRQIYVLGTICMEEFSHLAQTICSVGRNRFLYIGKSSFQLFQKLLQNRCVIFSGIQAIEYCFDYSMDFDNTIQWNVWWNYSCHNIPIQNFDTVSGIKARPRGWWTKTKYPTWWILVLWRLTN